MASAPSTSSSGLRFLYTVRDPSSLMWDMLGGSVGADPDGPASTEGAAPVPPLLLRRANSLAEGALQLLSATAMVDSRGCWLLLVRCTYRLGLALRRTAHELPSPAAIQPWHGGGPEHLILRTRHVSHALLLRRWGPVADVRCGCSAGEDGMWAAREWVDGYG